MATKKKPKLTKPKSTKPAKAQPRSAAKPKPSRAKAAKPPAAIPAGQAPVPIGSPAEAALRAFALALPGAVEAFPWGDRVVKVNKKVFVFMGTREGGGFGLSAKLPRSVGIALQFPFASPTRYGLGKSGWVSAAFAPADKPPLDLLEAWIEESYRAIAPAKLVAELSRRSSSGDRLP